LSAWKKKKGDKAAVLTAIFDNMPETDASPSAGNEDFALRKPQDILT
jgi:hypothetical protein